MFFRFTPDSDRHAHILDRQPRAMTDLRSAAASALAGREKVS
jgi:hypothetical protein